MAMAMARYVFVFVFVFESAGRVTMSAVADCSLRGSGGLG